MEEHLKEPGTGPGLFENDVECPKFRIARDPPQSLGFEAMHLTSTP